MATGKIYDFLGYQKESQKDTELVRAILNDLKYADLGEFLGFISTVDKKYPKLAPMILESSIVKSRVQEYIHKALGIVMPMDLPRGWTDDVKELVKDIVVDGWDKVDGKSEFVIAVKNVNDDFMYGTISRQRLLKILPYVPVSELLRRYNEAPLPLSFIDVDCNDAFYEISIIGKERPDEALLFEGVLLPIFDCDDAASQLLYDAIKAPEEFWHLKIGDKIYLRMWWD